MAEELRIIKGDTYDITVTVRDTTTGAVVPLLNIWEVIFESDTIVKNSVGTPLDFAIEYPPLTTGQLTVHLSTLETNQTICRDHYKIKLFKATTPNITKTVSSGDLFFIDEI